MKKQKNKLSERDKEGLKEFSKWIKQNKSLIERAKKQLERDE